MICRLISPWLLAAGISLPNGLFAQTWTQTTAPSKSWTSLACSADGSHLAATASSSAIYSSTNYGVTWTTDNVPNLGWTSVAMSADGSKQVASFTGGVYTSTNFG